MIDLPKAPFPITLMGLKLGYASDSLFFLSSNWTWLLRFTALRQAKGKARINAYEELVKESGARAPDKVEIAIPMPQRLGDVVVDAEGLHKAFGEKLLFDDLSFKLPPGGIVGIIGANGAGKTTLLKMIVGETIPSNAGAGGKFYVHPNLRIAYVAQHAFSHVERHMEESPVAYLQWRFKDGFDKEKLEYISKYRVNERILS